MAGKLSDESVLENLNPDVNIDRLAEQLAKNKSEDECWEDHERTQKEIEELPDDEHWTAIALDYEDDEDEDNTWRPESYYEDDDDDSECY